MAAIESALYPIVVKINEYLSSYILIFLLIGVGLWYTIKTRVVQVRYFGAGMKKVFGNLSLKGGKQKQGMSSFQALATAIAAQVGTGNIVGASGAILVGGPGAIFWMWVIAFLGMATIYAEATLAQKTRVIDKDGNVSQWRVIGRDGNALRHPVIGPRPFVYPSIDKRKTSLIINGDGAAFYFTSGDVCPDSRRLVLNNEGFLKEKNPVMYGGALVVPTVVDYDGDGTLYVVAGNAAGNILFFRNYGTDRTPVFRIGEKLKAGGVDIHIQPGYGEDIQGPIESRWGYVGPNVYDWNGDGFLDILTNDSRGKHRIFIGTDEGLKPEAPLYLNDIPLHGTWRCRPGVGVLAGKTVYITLDDQDEFHLYYREDDYNLKDGGKLLLTDGGAIKANWLEAGGKGRLRFDLVDWDGDGVKDLLLSTNKHHKIPADAPDGLPWTNPKKLQGSTILFMRNTGTEGAPVFDAPRQLSCKGRLIQLGHHACGAVACFLGEIIDDKPNILAADERGAFYLLNRADLTW